MVMLALSQSKALINTVPLRNARAPKQQSTQIVSVHLHGKLAITIASGVGAEIDMTARDFRTTVIDLFD